MFLKDIKAPFPKCLSDISYIDDKICAQIYAPITVRKLNCLKHFNGNITNSSMMSCWSSKTCGKPGGDLAGNCQRSPD